MTRKFRVLAVSMLLAATPLLSGCAVGGVVVECDGRANNVHQSRGTPSDIVGKATGECTAAVALQGYVEIQRKNRSGAWYSLKRTPFSFVATPSKSFTRQAATRCQSGTFRTHSYVVGTFKGKSETRERYSGETRNPCK